jgi:hypothetical protein
MLCIFKNKILAANSSGERTGLRNRSRFVFATSMVMEESTSERSRVLNDGQAKKNQKNEKHTRRKNRPLKGQ